MDRRKRAIFDAFCDPRNQEELYDLKSQAIALTNLEEFLEELVTTGILAERQHEGDEI